MKIELIRNKENHYKYEGTCLIANIINCNKRIYSESEIKNAIEKFEHKVKFRNFQSLGQIGHPNTATVDLGLASHILEKIELAFDNELNTLVARATIKTLPTPSGRTLQALYDADIKLYASTRAFAEVEVTNGYSDVKNLEIISVDILESKDWSFIFNR